MPEGNTSKSTIDFKAVHIPKLPKALVHRIQVELAKREISWSEFAIEAFELGLKKGKAK